MKETESRKKILVIRFSSIGDIILTTPVFRYLKNIFPNSEIHFLTREEYSIILQNNPYINRIISFNTKKGFSGLRMLKHNLEEEKYHAVFDLHGSLRSRYLTFLLNSDEIRRIKKYYLKRFLLVKAKINFFRNRGNSGSNRTFSVVEKYLRTCGFSETSGNFEQIKLELFPLSQDLKNADLFWKKFAGKSLRLAVAPGAKHFTKRWPAEYYGELAALLYKKYKLKTVFVGGPDEVQTVNEICKIADPKENFTVNLAGKLSLMETASIISHCSLFISNDSALMHVASAFQRFQIAIFGSTVRELGFFPLNPRSRILEKSIACRPCSHIGRPECPQRHFDCMREIKPTDVMNEFSDCMWVFKQAMKKDSGKKRK